MGSSAHYQAHAAVVREVVLLHGGPSTPQLRVKRREAHHYDVHVVDFCNAKQGGYVPRPFALFDFFAVELPIHLPFGQFKRSSATRYPLYDCRV